MLLPVIAAIALLALSGFPALAARNRAGEIAGTAIAVTGSISGLAGAIATLVDGRALTASTAWQLPGAALSARLDPLAAAFLLPIFLLGGLASVYGLSYWPAREQPSSARVRLFLGLLLAGMATVVIAAHAMLFLFAWETMALASFFLIATDDREPEVRDAAWIYLIATHVGTLALFAMFVAMRALAGSFALGPIAGAGAVASTSIFLLALFGFGFKAGVVPLHFWLPGAHANAPSHVSAVLSGAMLKVGIYGLLRVVTWIPTPFAWWGGALVAIGLCGALAAIVLAIGECDMKRALAWSSVENVGIILAAVGVATYGRATGDAALAAIGLTAAVLHVWNHSLFKGLLFFAAGSVLHATGTRRIELLGGLFRRMPVTGGAFVLGACAASALPGANAFVSEALLYYGFFVVAPRGSLLGFGAALLALVGALAVVSFVRLAGTVMLGSARSEHAEHAHEAAPSMRLPLAALSVVVLFSGVFPTALLAPLSAVVPAAAEHCGPFLSAISLPVQLAAAAAALALLSLLATTRRSPRQVTWDCGYAAPTPRMQYTGRSIGEWINERLVPEFLRPDARGAMPSGPFPASARFGVDTREPFTERLYLPLAARWARRAMRFRWIQQGLLPSYLLYILLTLVAGVCWAIVYPMLDRWWR
jgi:formate hydrogenlyase subunit 3/multisubunit Na+/H+ antiporter MnhD subunit